MQHECNTNATRVRHEQHKCDTSVAQATKVRNKCETEKFDFENGRLNILSLF